MLDADAAGFHGSSVFTGSGVLACFFLIPALFSCWFAAAAPGTYKQVAEYS